MNSTETFTTIVNGQPHTMFRVGDAVRNYETKQEFVIAELLSRSESALSGTPCYVRLVGGYACCILTIEKVEQV